MTEEQIIKGVWYWNTSKKWPPDSITYFDDLYSTESLNLNITQLNLSSSEQKKIIKKWCDELPKLTSVKYLWFCSKVSQEIFEAICKMENLEGLYIKWSSIKNIDALINLEKLKYLHIGSSAQIESIKVFRNINWIKTLNLEQLNKITDFEDISNMSELNGLGIDGSTWSTQKIDSLKPLENLTKLKYLTLTNTQVKDKSFDPILNLTELIRFNSSWNYPESEFDKLRKLPNLKFGNIETSWKEIKGKL